MINLYLTLAILILFLLVGLIGYQVLKIEKNYLEENSLLYIAPLFGAFIVMCFTQIINLFLPVKYIAIPFFILLIAGLLFFQKDILYYIKYFIKDRFIICFILILLLILEIPLLIKNELVSIQKFNNDIMYYLTTLDWFQEHTLLTPVTYTETSLYFWCAEYMIDLTRLGFDVLTSLLMSIFNVESYQIFSIMGYAHIIIACLTLLFVLKSVFMIPEKWCRFALIFCAAGGGWVELITYQYCPQLLGMAGMAAFIGCLIKLYTTRERIWLIFTAFIITGTVTVYAEYAVYLVSIYIIIGLVNFILHQGNLNAKINCLIPAIQAGFLALILNPVGIFICIRFNINTFIKVQDDISQLDPYFGKTLTLPNAVGRILGVAQTTLFQSQILKLIINVINIITALAIIFMILYVLKKKWSERISHLYYGIGILSFCIIYFLYFHNIKYAYGEFKHLSTVTPIVLIILSYFWYQLYTLVKRKSRLFLFSGCFFIFIILSFGVVSKSFYNELYYFDNELMEVADVAKLIPSDEPIGISGKTASIHGQIYALKEHQSVILANNISYYPFSLVPSTRYMLSEDPLTSEIPDIYHNNHKAIWNNNRFVLYENLGIRTDIYSGFHQLEYNGSESWRWTCEQNATLNLKNYSENNRKIQLTFYSEGKNNRKETISVFCDNRLIAKSITGTYITTDSFELPAGSNKLITIRSEKPLSKGDGNETRTLGVKIQNFQISDAIYE